MVISKDDEEGGITISPENLRSDIFSPASGGRVNPISVSIVMRKHGRIRLKAESMNF